MGPFQSVKSIESKQEKIETYPAYAYKNVFKYSIYEKHILNINTKHIKMCKYHLFSCLAPYILFYIVQE